MGLVCLIQTTTGRTARILLDGGLITLGVALGGGWLALVAVGLIPIFAGLVGVCFGAPLLNMPLRNTARS